MEKKLKQLICHTLFNRSNSIEPIQFLVKSNCLFQNEDIAQKKKSPQYFFLKTNNFFTKIQQF